MLYCQNTNSCRYSWFVLQGCLDINHWRFIIVGSFVLVQGDISTRLKMVFEIDHPLLSKTNSTASASKASTQQFYIKQCKYLLHHHIINIQNTIQHPSSSLHPNLCPHLWFLSPHSPHIADEHSPGWRTRFYDAYYTTYFSLSLSPPLKPSRSSKLTTTTTTTTTCFHPSQVPIDPTVAHFLPTAVALALSFPLRRDFPSSTQKHMCMCEQATPSSAV